MLFVPPTQGNGVLGIAPRGSSKFHCAPKSTPKLFPVSCATPAIETSDAAGGRSNAASNPTRRRGLLRWCWSGGASTHGAEHSHAVSSVLRERNGAITVPAKRRRQAARAALVALALGSVAAAVPSSARAQSAASAASEALFRDGRRLMADGDYAQGCPKLAESFRLEPATGTLLALALCHRSQGRTATAWAEFSLAATRARREGRADRDQAASAWAAELEPKLSSLTLVVPDAVANLPGIVVKRDGVGVGRAGWNTSTPVDPGDHSVEVTAPGRAAWAGLSHVQSDGDKQTLLIPMLDSVHPEPKGPDSAASKPSLSTMQWAGIATAGLGVIGLGIGTVFGIEAIRKNQQSDDGCDGDACAPDAKEKRLSARVDGNISTAAFVAGGALLGGGAALYFLGAKRDGGRGRVQLAPAIGWQGWGVSVHGSF